jgi:hypothetical protein
MQADDRYCTFQNLVTFATFILKNDHSGNIWGQDQEFWTVNAVKQHFEEQLKQYYITLFP